jgi:hypothetical protein
MQAEGELRKPSCIGNKAISEANSKASLLQRSTQQKSSLLPNTQPKPKSCTLDNIVDWEAVSGVNERRRNH